MTKLNKVQKLHLHKLLVQRKWPTQILPSIKCRAHPRPVINEAKRPWTLVAFQDASSTILVAEEASSTLLPVAFECAEGAGVRYVAVLEAFSILLHLLFDCVEGTGGCFSAL